MSNMTRIFHQIIAPAADDVTTLRNIDLDRVLMNADENFPQVRDGFVRWLENQRPDLLARISNTVDELIDLGLWATT